MSGPATPLRALVGAKTATVLEQELGLATAGDLLAHYPRRWVERNTPADFGELDEGEHVTVLGRVESAKQRPMQNRTGTIVKVVVRDDRGKALELAFFGKKDQHWRLAMLKPGSLGLFAGVVGRFNTTWQLSHPDYLLIDEEHEREARRFLAAVIPVYPATAKISSWTIALATATVLEMVVPGPDDDPLPADLRRREGLPDLGTALRGIHVPASMADVALAQRRLKWDEALTLQVALAQRRAAAVRLPAAPRPPRADGILAAFDAALPFDLTAGQREVGATLAAEIAEPHPMHRLLAGEVGSGKTVVALRAMLAVVDAGGQAALLAPTEVLATQHLRSLRALLGPLGAAGELDGAPEATRVVLLTGSQGAAARRAALAAAADGSAGIVVGTHALLSETVTFADLGLVVVDEQHRFGVEQRDALRARGRLQGDERLAPHVLVMTATPIPRTVAMTVFGDLETSSLTELPRGRSPITTHVVGTDGARVARMWGLVREQVAAGHQAYVVCPRIEAGEPTADGQRPGAAVEQTGPSLAAGPLAGLRLGVLHGRLPADERDAVMREFAAGALDVLVATTVIEVGVDVPNATVMCVLDAERFGVSQLHQLRGRIGRGAAASVCLLATAASELAPSRQRLAAVAATTDGAVLARVDLETRQEGDVLGAAQSGARSRLKLLRLSADEDIVVAARAEAQALVAADPALAAHPALAAALTRLTDDAGFLEKG